MIETSTATAGTAAGAQNGENPRPPVLAFTPKDRHPLNVAAYREIQGKDFSELCDQIRKRGLLDPISLYEGKVLDGWNRQRACLEVGTEPRYVEFRGTLEEAMDLVVSRNTRREMKRAARILAAAEVLKAYNKLRKSKTKDSSARGGGKREQNAQTVGKQVNASPRQIERANTVARSGIKEVQDAVRDETITLDQGAAIAKLAESSQKKVLERVKSGEPVKSAVAGSVSYGTDAAGNECPSQAATVLQTAAAVGNVLKLLRNCHTNLTSMSLDEVPGSYAARLALTKKSKGKDGAEGLIVPELEVVCKELEESLPFACGCTACLRVGPEPAKEGEPDCKVCGGQGFSTKYAWEQAPKEQRQKVILKLKRFCRADQEKADGARGKE